MLKIISVLCRAGTMDNYSYILIDEKTGLSAIVDPSEVSPIVDECQKQKIIPNYILNTHHHYDHTDGNLELKELYNAKIVGAEVDRYRISGLDIGLNDGDVFELGDSKAEIIRVDGHTIGHILWYFKADKALFTGDMLFNLCIGGLFEGTPAQMWSSVEKVKNLPDDTLFYPGHEYTVYGLRNLNTPDLIEYAKKASSRLEQGRPVAPVSLEEEKRCNPYLIPNNFADFSKLF